MAIIVKGGGGKPEEEKTVTVGTSVMEVNPSSGKVMKKVTVNPTPTESKSVTPTTSELTVTPSEGKHLSQVVVGSIADGGGVVPKVNLDATTITPGTENQVINAGTYLKGDLTVLGDEDLIPANIKEGKNIFGVVGAVVENTVKTGSYMPASIVASVSIPHGLGKTPKYYGVSKVPVYVYLYSDFVKTPINVTADANNLYISAEDTMLSIANTSAINWCVIG